MGSNAPLYQARIPPTPPQVTPGIRALCPVSGGVAAARAPAVHVRRGRGTDRRVSVKHGGGTSYRRAVRRVGEKRARLG